MPLYIKNTTHIKDSLSLPSTVIGSISYSQKSQIVAPLQAVIYFNNNKTILVSDWRYLKYPSYTYGLGMNTSPADQDLLNYEYLKLHQTLLFQIRPHIYLGTGYILDYFWDISEVAPKPGNETDFEKYGPHQHLFLPVFPLIFCGTPGTIPSTPIKEPTRMWC